MKSLKYQSMQDMFNNAYKGLHGQMFTRSFLQGEGCLYRGPDNTRCAIGHCIPDGDYSGAMENQRVLHVFEKLGLKIYNARTGAKNKKFKFASELQGIHDDNSNPAIMERKLIKFAVKNNLTIPAV